MTTSTAKRFWQRPSWTGRVSGVLAMLFFGTCSVSVAQELNGSLILDQTHTGTVQALNKVAIGDFTGSYLVESTLATGNGVEASLSDGGAVITQLQTENATAQSNVTAGTGTVLRDTSIATGNAISLSSDGQLGDFAAKATQTNQGPTTASIVLDAGSIEFYGAFLDASGNDAVMRSDGLHSEFSLSQNNGGANAGSLQQTGNSASATTQFVVAGNKVNLGSGQQAPVRAPAYTE